MKKILNRFFIKLFAIILVLIILVTNYQIFSFQYGLTQTRLTAEPENLVNIYKEKAPATYYKNPLTFLNGFNFNSEFKKIIRSDYFLLVNDGDNDKYVTTMSQLEKEKIKNQNFRKDFIQKQPISIWIYLIIIIFIPFIRINWFKRKKT